MKNTSYTTYCSGLSSRKRFRLEAVVTPVVRCTSRHEAELVFLEIRATKQTAVGAFSFPEYQMYTLRSGLKNAYYVGSSLSRLIL